MSRTATLLATLVVASAVVVTAARARPPAPPDAESALPAPDPEHARLIALCGTWDVELTFWFKPGGPGVTSKGTSTIRPLFDGLFVEEKIEGALNSVPFTTLSWTGYNTATHQYEATRIASTNTIQIAETGAWEEQARHFELKGVYSLAGESWTQRTVIQPTAADAMVVASYLSFGKVPEWKGVEIKYTRKAK